MSEAIVREYYDHFNGRRLAEAAGLFADDAVIQHLFFQQLQGPEGSTRFAQAWLQAFPDARLHVESLVSRDGTLHEIDLLVTGTHLGTLEMGVYRFQAADAAVRVRMRHLCECRDGRIIFSSLSFDLHAFVQQVVSVDLPALKRRLEHIQALREELESVRVEPGRQREILQYLGTELDAARKVLRPYFYR